MNIIKRDVYVLTDKLKQSIYYVQGTDTVPIVFNFRDIIIPDKTRASVFIKKPSGKEIYDTANIDIANGSVTVNITKQMSAESGKSDLQIELKNEESVLCSFLECLEVKKSLFAICSETGSSVLDMYIKRIDEMITIALNDTSEKAEYATAQGDYAKTQGDYAKTQGGYAKTQGDYAKTEGINVRSEFESLKETLAGIQNGDLLLEIQELLDDLFRTARDIDIDNIIGNTYIEEDEEGGIFESGTHQDIDDIIGGTYIENQ